MTNEEVWVRVLCAAIAANGGVPCNKEDRGLMLHYAAQAASAALEEYKKAFPPPDYETGAF